MAVETPKVSVASLRAAVMPQIQEMRSYVSRLVSDTRRLQTMMKEEIASMEENLIGMATFFGEKTVQSRVTAPGSVVSLCEELDVLRQQQAALLPKGKPQPQADELHGVDEASLVNHIAPRIEAVSSVNSEILEPLHQLRESLREKGLIATDGKTSAIADIKGCVESLISRISVAREDLVMYEHSPSMAMATFPGMKNSSVMRDRQGPGRQRSPPPPKSRRAATLPQLELVGRAGGSELVPNDDARGHERDREIHQQLFKKRTLKELNLKPLNMERVNPLANVNTENSRLMKQRGKATTEKIESFLRAIKMEVATISDPNPDKLPEKDVLDHHLLSLRPTAKNSVGALNDASGHGKGDRGRSELLLKKMEYSKYRSERKRVVAPNLGVE